MSASGGYELARRLLEVAFSKRPDLARAGIYVNRATVRFSGDMLAVDFILPCEYFEPDRRQRSEAARMARMMGRSEEEIEEGMFGGVYCLEERVVFGRNASELVDKLEAAIEDEASRLCRALSSVLDELTLEVRGSRYLVMWGDDRRGIMGENAVCHARFYVEQLPSRGRR